MTRKEMYDKIKSLKLENEIKEKFGRNFTQVSNMDLLHIINAKKSCCKSTSKVKQNDKVDKLIILLQKKRILLNSEVKELLD